MDTLLQDLKYGFRMLGKSPSFVAVAIISLALGIGANTAIFTLVKAVLLQPLPLFEPHRLVTMVTIDDQYPGLLPVSYPDFEDIRDRQSMFSGMSLHTFTSFSVSRGNGDPETINGEIVTGNFFELMGARPALGRTFSGSEDQAPGQAPLIVLSHGSWTRRFGGDPKIIGQKLNINRQPFTVIGVMPPGFRGINALREPSAWVPMSMALVVLSRPQALRDRKALYFAVSARLKPGVSLEQAQASLEPLAQQLARDNAQVNRGRTYKLIPITEATMAPETRHLLQKAGLVMMITAGMVLLIACANVAALQMVRARGRTKEFAVRLALGASAWRITRQMLTESLVLSLAGGLLGLAVARWSRDLIWNYRPPVIAGVTLDLSLDRTVLLFTLGISMASGVLFGLAPALNSWRKDLASDLKERSSQLVRERRFFGIRNLLVVGQCALSVVALIGAGMFLESLRRAQQVDPGFNTHRLLIGRFNLAAIGYKKEQGLEFNRQLVERLSAIPSIRSTSFSLIIPLSSGGFMRGAVQDGENPDSKGVMVLTNNVGLRYFETAGIRMLEGRDFDATDRDGAQRVVIVNQSMARRFWPGQSAVGKRFRFENDPNLQLVIAVVADTKFFSLNEEKIECVYLPLLQNYITPLTLLVQSNSNPSLLQTQVRAELRQMDRNLPQVTLTTIEEQIGRLLWTQRLIAGLLAVFGLLGLLLAAVGVYGLTSYAVTQRVSEIGIRLALGATPLDIMRSVVGQAMLLVIPGLLLGMVASLASTKFAQSLLFGVSAMHAPTYFEAAFLLTVVALLACYLPARRATKVDPLTALRHE